MNNRVSPDDQQNVADVEDLFNTYNRNSERQISGVGREAGNAMDLDKNMSNDYEALSREPIPKSFVIHVIADKHLTETNNRWPGPIKVTIEGVEYLATGYNIE